MLYQTDKLALPAHVWEKGHTNQNKNTFLKHITIPKHLTVWEKLFIKKNEDHIMNNTK